MRHLREETDKDLVRQSAAEAVGYAFALAIPAPRSDDQPPLLRGPARACGPALVLRLREVHTLWIKDAGAKFHAHPWRRP